MKLHNCEPTTMNNPPVFEEIKLREGRKIKNVSTFFSLFHSTIATASYCTSELKRSSRERNTKGYSWLNIKKNIILI